MLAAPSRWISSELLAPTVTVGVRGLEGGSKVTPVVVHAGKAASAYIAPLGSMEKTWTEAGFGLVTRRMTSALPPGARVEDGTSPPVRADITTGCMVAVPTVAEPEPEPAAQ